MRSPTPPTGPAGAGITNTAPRPATTPATEPGSHDQRSTTAVLVACGLELLDDALRDAATGRDLDAVCLGPLPDSYRADVRLAGPGASVAPGSGAPATAGLACGVHVAG